MMPQSDTLPIAARSALLFHKVVLMSFPSTFLPVTAAASKAAALRCCTLAALWMGGEDERCVSGKFPCTESRRDGRAPHQHMMIAPITAGTSAHAVRYYRCRNTSPLQLDRRALSRIDMIGRLLAVGGRRAARKRRRWFV